MKKWVAALLSASLALLIGLNGHTAAVAVDLCPPGCEGNDTGTTCRVCSHEPGDPGDGGGGGGTPSLPACPPTPDAIPDASGEPIPDGWVLVRCKEGGLTLLFWVPRSVSPRTLAVSLLDSMDLEPIDIGMAPKGADAVALVGMPVWLWVDDPSRTTWGPSTISAGGVTLTARVTKVRWDMGDGTKLSCGLGTEWKYGMGGDPSPTCGHTYQKRGKVTVTATAFWVAHWSGYGQSGDIHFQLVRTRELPVGELQVIVTRNGR